MDQKYSLESFIEKKLNDKASFNDFITVFACLSLSDEKLNNLLDCIGDKEIILEDPIKANYIRIIPVQYAGFPALRLDIKKRNLTAGTAEVVCSCMDNSNFPEFAEQQITKFLLYFKNHIGFCSS